MGDKLTIYVVATMNRYGSYDFWGAGRDYDIAEDQADLVPEDCGPYRIIGVSVSEAAVLSAFAVPTIEGDVSAPAAAPEEQRREGE